MAFRLPTHVSLQPGASCRLPEVATELGARRVLLVVDAGILETGAPRSAVARLLSAGCEVGIFDSVEANPQSTTIEALAEKVRGERAEMVLGFGGGSVLDAAKAAAMLATNEGLCVDFEGKNRFSEAPLPFVAVPTTCGTGSEVTWVSVITVRSQRTKISVKGDAMFPDHALVDADLLRTLPAGLVASTGADALTHALEAITGKPANPASDALAYRAIALMLAYLPRAVADIAGDGEARQGVMEASCLAGMAFGNADVGGVHCLSEALGGLYDLPHGLTNAVLLLPVMRSHGESVHGSLARLEAHLQGLSPATGATAAVEADLAETAMARIEGLIEALDLPSFSELGIPGDGHSEVAERAQANGSNDSNPRPMTAEDYAAVLAGLTS